MSRVERGADPRLSTAFPLAAALGQPIEVVFADYIKPSRPGPVKTRTKRVPKRTAKAVG